MDIKIDYNIGDDVWTMKDNKPYKFTLFRIDVSVTKKAESVYLVEYIDNANSGDHIVRRSIVDCAASMSALRDMVFK